MDNISIDWPISRRRWYHTEIPFGKRKREHIIVPPAGTYVQPWKDAPPKGSRVLQRDTREDIGSYSDLKEQMGQIRGRESLRYMDGFFQLQSVCQRLSQPTRGFRKGLPNGFTPARKRNRSHVVVYTLLKSRSCLSNLVSSMYGSMDWAWTHGAENVQIAWEWNRCR